MFTENITYDRNGHKLKVGDFIFYGVNQLGHLSKIKAIDNEGRTLRFVKDDFWNVNDNFSTIRENWEYISPDDALIYKFSE